MGAIESGMTATPPRTRTVTLTYTNDGSQRRGFDVGGLSFRLELEVRLMFSVPSMTADGVSRALVSGWEAMWQQHRKRTGLVLMEPELDTAFEAFAEAQGGGLLAAMRGAEYINPYVTSCPFEPECLGSVRLELVQEEPGDWDDD